MAENNSTPLPPPPRMTADMVLASLLRVCASLFATPAPQESAAIIVNRVSELVRVDRAVLVPLAEKRAILAVTGGGAAAQDSSFADAVEAVRDKYGDSQEPLLIPPISDDDKKASPHLKKVQAAMGGTSILWMPLWLSHDRNILPAHALWLERWRGVPWEMQDAELLRHAALFMGHALLRPKKIISRPVRRFFKWGIAIAILVFLGMPVTSGVMAPAKVVPDHPNYIFAPMDGILKELLVKPGQWVDENAPLFRYDARVLDKRLEEAYRSVASAKAKFVKLEGAAHRDPEARAELSVQKLEVERAEADVKFYAQQQSRAEVHTAKPGVIVLDDPDALIGAALQTGQTVLSVADPSKTKLHLMVAAADVGLLKKDAEVSVRMDSEPLESFAAKITRIGFDIRISENQVPSVMAEAVWTNQAPKAQPGQKGSAKIFGPMTVMGMQLFRKPFIVFRTFIGL